MMASLSHELYQFMLSHGFCVGIGSGLVYVPTVAICVDYFSRYRGLALGVAAIGSSLGSIIYPIMFNRLRPRIGFPWTMRVIAFMAFGLLLIALALVRPRGASAASNPCSSRARSASRPMRSSPPPSSLVSWACTSPTSTSPPTRAARAT